MTERRTPDRIFSSRAPVHSVLVQKSVTTITNFAGRLSGLDARQTLEVSQALACKKMAFHLPERCPVILVRAELKRYNRLRKTGVKGASALRQLKQKAAIAA
jgi:hypothetical protein